MMSQYQDKSTEFAAYRMLLVGMSVAADVLIVLVTTIAMPQISAFAMCALCLAVVLVTLVFQVRVDHTLIFSGQFLVEDGMALYAVIGIFGLGFGKRHRQNRKINSYRFFCLDHVKKVDNRPFGIRVAADVYTATTNEVSVDKEVFNTPGAMKKILMEQGKKKRVVFRIEHNLKECEEKRLLEKLECLKEAALPLGS